MQARRLAAAAAVLTLSLCVGRAQAHPVIVDGTGGEWLARDPAAANLGIVARDGSGAGELVWLDQDGDARTDLSSPEEHADLLRLAVTADADSLYLLAEMAASPLTAGAQPPQLQVAIDLDRTPSSGQEFFAGLSDTRVADAARWEYLVRTQGAAVTAVDVLDTGFASVGSGTVLVNGNTIEIGVPWSALGLSGPPAVMRLSVATFREDTASGDVVSVGDENISDALDALTDYGTAASAGNTWDEVMDQVVDYHVDVWMDADGEAYAPLLVDRFLTDPSGADPEGEWMRLRNATGGALSLDGFAVGDEEAPGAGEGMALLPADSIGAGSTYVVAQSGSTFSSLYGVAADAEHDGDDAAVPDTTPATDWATGDVALSNSGDELLVVGPRRTILDVVTYGGGAYAGVGAMTAPGVDEVARRSPATQDTDDNAVDFALAATCAADGDCGACESCVELSCAPLAGCTPDAGTDAGGADAGIDAGIIDAGIIDAGTDAGPADAGMDAAVVDAGGMDAGADAAVADAGMDAGSSDGGAGEDAATTMDAGSGEDAGRTDAGRTDAGRPDAAGGEDAGGSSRRSSGGCDCRTAGGGPLGPALPALLLALVLGLRRRR